MIKSIKVSLKQNPYPILIGTNILSKVGRYLKELKTGEDAVIITNPIIQRNHGKALISSLKKEGFSVKIIAIPSGEQAKSAQQAFKIIEKVARYDVMKKIFIIAFGGGVVGDLTGYVASAYKRGIPYVQIPTTFLAQIDSAIGGKVAIDLPVGKNLVGSYYHPKLVFSDVAVLKTLNVRQIRNGLAEAVKYGVIYDQQLFKFIENNFNRILKLDFKALLKVVSRSSEIKTAVVESDEKETKGIRTILNFGHTVGHAIEAAAEYHDYHHGEAIALGMRVAAEISYQLKLMKRKEVLRLNQLLTNIGLPKRIKKVNLRKILSMMRHDKKFISRKNRFVLSTGLGHVKIVENIPMSVIVDAIKSIM